MKRLLLGIVIGALGLFAYQRANRPEPVPKRWRAVRRPVRSLNSANIGSMKIALCVAAVLLPLAATADESFRCGIDRSE